MAKSPGSAQDFANSIGQPGGDRIGAANAAGFDVNIHTIPNGNSVTQIVTVKNPATGETGVSATNRPFDPGPPDDPYTPRESSYDFPAKSPNADADSNAPPPRPDPNEPPDYGMEPEEPSDIPDDDTFAWPDEENPETPSDEELPPEDSDIPPDDETPPEDEDTPEEEEPPPEEGDAQEGCSYCVPAPNGGLLSGIPIIGGIADGIQNGLHLITNGLHEGNIWKIMNGALQLYDAASDILMVKAILKKLGQKAFKEAFKEALDELIKRKEQDLGLDKDAAIAAVITEMLEKQIGTMSEDQREFTQNMLEMMLGLDKSKPDRNKPQNNVDSNGNNGPPAGTPGVDVPSGPDVGPSAPATSGKPPKNDADSGKHPDDDSPAKDQTPDHQRIAKAKKDNERKARAERKRAEKLRAEAEKESDPARKAILEQKAQNAESSAKGYETENKVIDALGDQVVDADVKLDKDGKPNAKSQEGGQIDVVTKTEAIEVKSGNATPTNNQLQALQDFADSTKPPKKPVIYSNMTPEEILKKKTKFPGIDFRKLSDLGIKE